MTTTETVPRFCAQLCTFTFQLTIVSTFKALGCDARLHCTAALCSAHVTSRSCVDGWMELLRLHRDKTISSSLNLSQQHHSFTATHTHTQTEQSTHTHTHTHTTHTTHKHTISTHTRNTVQLKHVLVKSHVRIEAVASDAPRLGPSFFFQFHTVFDKNSKIIG